METNKKQYGLIFPKKGSSVTVPSTGIKKPSVFNESDSEEESNVDWVKKALQKETYGGGALSRQSRADIKKVLAEDPTCYQYDELYDEMTKKKDEAVIAKNSEKKPKYVHLLIAQAERRKKEDERRKERQIQKEREAEGDEFVDKECFVTTAYKKKLEEMKKLDEEQKRQDMLEEIGDVTKQQDLSGFYRHMYEKIVDRDTTTIKEESKSEDESKNADDKLIPNIKSKVQRQYRKRVSESDSESEKEYSSPTVVNDEKSKREQKCGSRSSKEHLAKRKRVEISDPESVNDVKKQSNSKNIDADSVSSSDDIDSVSNSQTSRSKDSEKHVDIEKDGKTKGETSDVEEEKSTKNNENQKDEEKENKPKRLIWEKRTVGEVYESALQRYYERKANRLAVLEN